MPRFDRTGPEGQGSRTGRGFGKCDTNNQRSDEQKDLEDYPKAGVRGLGRRLARGFGFGRGMGRRFGKDNS